jgi:hypothetical protein
MLSHTRGLLGVEILVQIVVVRRVARVSTSHDWLVRNAIGLLLESLAQLLVRTANTARKLNYLLEFIIKEEKNA